MKDLNESVGRRLVALRRELGLTVGQLAERYNVQRTRWNNWEGGVALPAMPVMIALCDDTKVTLDYLYRGKSDTMPMGLAVRLLAREQGVDPDMERRLVVEVARRD